MPRLYAFLLLFLPATPALAQDIYAGPSPETLFSIPAEQAFLKEFNEKFKADFDAPTQYARLAVVSVDEWEMALFDARKGQNAFYKSHPQAGQFSDPFKKFVESSIRWNYWHLLLAYAIQRSNAQTGHAQVTSLPAAMLDGFDENKVADEAALPAATYRNFLSVYVTYFNSKDHQFAKYADASKALQDKATFARQHLSGKPYQYALARLLHESCEKATPSLVKSLFGILAALPGSEGYAAAVKAKCGEVMTRKDEPVMVKKEEKVQEPGPNVFFFTDQQGQPVTLDAFRGKVVYLDVWASWCGPCRAEFPFSKSLHERLEAKHKGKVAFLYLSIDDTEGAWKAALNSLKLPGEQGWSKGGWRSKVVQYLGVQSIPRYVLIDKAGNIADTNAKRPSNPEGIWGDIVKLIEK